MSKFIAKITVSNEKSLKIWVLQIPKALSCSLLFILNLVSCVNIGEFDIIAHSITL
jgi:hypothetical protein